MKRLINSLNILFKELLLITKPHIFLSWMVHPLRTLSNVIQLSKWISVQDKNVLINDFYTRGRNYNKRYAMYEKMIEGLTLKDASFDYIEFGVFEGHSIKWWANHNSNKDSKFFGFDTFEGLPEAWGTFAKGDMTAKMPNIEDDRVLMVKGLFQDSVPQFIASKYISKEKKKIIHFDADLFSSTLYALTTMAPFLKKGDILIFDEFNVPNHEFNAFKIFSDSYYIKTRLLGAVNNYYQVALEIQ